MSEHKPIDAATLRARAEAVVAQHGLDRLHRFWVQDYDEDLYDLAERGLIPAESWEALYATWLAELTPAERAELYERNHLAPSDVHNAILDDLLRPLVAPTEAELQ